jgi:hypothetical protein
VRIVAMRATIHLLSADDCLLLRPLMQPVLDAELARHPEFGPALREVDLDEVLAFVRPLVAAAPRSGPELRAALAERFPEHDAAALAYACRNRLAFVQVPPRGVWGQTLQVTSTTAESWLGRPLTDAPSIDDVVIRYLAAFGPATVADVASWSRLAGMRAVVERLRPHLRTFRDERGRELFDLPDAPRPDADTPAPPRFLPEYDNVLLAHADRARFHTGAPRPSLSRTIHGTVLSDGTVCATWRFERAASGAVSALVVEQLRPLSGCAGTAVAAEGRRLTRFLGDGAPAADLRLVAPPG